MSTPISPPPTYSLIDPSPSPSPPLIRSAPIAHPISTHQHESLHHEQREPLEYGLHTDESNIIDTSDTTIVPVSMSASASPTNTVTPSQMTPVQPIANSNTNVSIACITIRF